MDETSLRGELERVLADEPPLGTLVGRSLRAGRMRRRRRRVGVAALCAVAAAVVIAVPTLLTSASRPAPAAPAAVAARTAYVVVGTDTVLPVSLATNKVGTPINGLADGVPTRDYLSLAASSPDGRTVYEIGTELSTKDASGIVVPIDTTTRRADRPITLSFPCPPGSRVPLSSCPVYLNDIVIDPDGKTGYVSFDKGVFPINLARKTAGKPIAMSCECRVMAFAPDRKTLYVVDPFPIASGQPPRYQAAIVTPIRTATNTALAPIRLPVAKHSLGMGFLSDVAITPNGKTAYVVDGRGGSPYENFVFPIDLAAKKALAPVRLKARGLATRLVISPGGGTAYVVSARAVTPINTATNTAGPPINIPDRDGLAYDIALTPNGKTIYVLTPRGVIPIRTASRTVLPMIAIPDVENPSFDPFVITPDGRAVWVATNAGILPISTPTNTAGSLIKVGAPGSIAFAR